MSNLDAYKAGGRQRDSTNLLLLLGELEGTSRHLKYMGFAEDLEIVNEMKKKYYALHRKTKKEEMKQCSSETWEGVTCDW